MIRRRSPWSAGAAREARVAGGATVALSLIAAILIAACGPGAGYRRAGSGDVLSVRWRRLISEPPLVEYKPQEFASAASDGRLVFIGSRTSAFLALRARDGAVAWKAAVGGGVSSQPLYLADTRTLYVGSNDGALHAIDAVTGAERWRYATRGSIASRPAYGDGSVYFTNGAGRVYSVDAQTGAFRWQYDRERPESFTIRGYSGPLVHLGRVYVGFADGYLAALNARTGDVVWARSMAADGESFLDVDATPVLADGVIYTASYAGGVHAVDPESGGVIWRYPVVGAGAVTVAGGRVYFTATRAGIHCLDSDGRLLWRQGLAEQGELSAPVALDQRYLMVSAAAGGAYVVDMETHQLSQYFHPGHGVTAPAVYDGQRRQVYLLTNTGFVYAFALAGAS